MISEHAEEQGLRRNSGFGVIQLSAMSFALPTHAKVQKEHTKKRKQPPPRKKARVRSIDGTAIVDIAKFCLAVSSFVTEHRARAGKKCLCGRGAVLIVTVCGVSAFAPF